MFPGRSSQILSDATNRSYWGARLKQLDATPSARPPTRKSDTPTSAAREGAQDSPAGTRPSLVRGLNHTPQKALFEVPQPRKYLLRDVAEAPHLTVILDLDETLVSNRRADLPQAILRPYVMDMLAAMRALPGIEIVLWTASTQETGSPVVEQLEARGKVFDDVIFRNDKWFTEPIHTKDLRLLGRDVSKVVVFDNAPNCCKLNPFNAVLVEDFVGNCTPEDRSLHSVYKIVHFLITHTAAGHAVSDILRHLANTSIVPEQFRELLHEVHIPMPETWSHVTEAHLRAIDPLLVPPRGAYFRCPSGLKK